MRRIKYVAMVIGFVVIFGMALVIVAIGLNRMVPYQPFIVRSYTVTPNVVCTSGEVTALVTRRFTDQVSSFSVTETWVRADNPNRIAFGRPVESNEGSLPPEVLKPTRDYITRPSPLITEAPSIPGHYKVKITAHAEGYRLGLPTSGTEVFFSDGSVTIRDCGEFGASDS